MTDAQIDQLIAALSEIALEAKLARDHAETAHADARMLSMLARIDTRLVETISRAKIGLHTKGRIA